MTDMYRGVILNTWCSRYSHGEIHGQCEHIWDGFKLWCLICWPSKRTKFEIERETIQCATCGEDNQVSLTAVEFQCMSCGSSNELEIMEY
jgi:hypothetical protein